MNARESIAFLQPLLAQERETAARWSLQGWPGDANHHRHQERELQRMIHRCEARLKGGRS